MAKSNISFFMGYVLWFFKYLRKYNSLVTQPNSNQAFLDQHLIFLDMCYYFYDKKVIKFTVQTFFYEKILLTISNHKHHVSIYCLQ